MPRVEIAPSYPQEVRDRAVALIIENQGDLQEAYDQLRIELANASDNPRVPRKQTMKKWALKSEDAFPMVQTARKRGIGQDLYYALQKFTKHVVENMDEIPPSRWPVMLDYLVKNYLDVTEGRAKNQTSVNNLVTLNFGDPRRYMEFVNKVDDQMAKPIEAEVLEVT